MPRGKPIFSGSSKNSKEKNPEGAEIMKTLVRLAFSMLLFAHTCALTSLGQQTATTPAAVRARELITLYSSGDRAAARFYITQNFTPEALGRVPIEERVNTISRIHDQTRGIELQSIRETNRRRQLPSYAKS
jgi:hypothetical protein